MIQIHRFIEAELNWTIYTNFSSLTACLILDNKDSCKNKCCSIELFTLYTACLILDNKRT